MNKYIEAAIDGFKIAVENLREFTRENTDFDVDVQTENYPIRFVFLPSEDAMQESLFEPDENGVLGEMVVIVSSTGTGVDLGLKCHMQADILKKLLSKCTAVAEAYLHYLKADMCGR